MALYRKYRPATFADVIGQEHVTEPLCAALSSGRIHHAYLFSGPRGCGKTSSARILARSLNCAQGPTPTPCGICDSCRALGPEGMGNVDVIELDAASHGGVDDTRELRDHAFYIPAQSRYRIFIIDEAHMVTPAGFNALLKIVEEPPEHLIFIFATTEPEKVLPTIRSRTYHYPFRLLSPKVMTTLITRICHHEHIIVDDSALPLIIRAGGGSPRDTLSVLDQLLSCSDIDSQGQCHISYQRTSTLLGIADVALIDSVVDALATHDAPTVFSLIETVIDSGYDPRSFALSLLERFRDLLLLSNLPNAAEQGIITVPDDVFDTMTHQIHLLSPAQLTRYAELTHQWLAEMYGATSPRLLLEVLCARLLISSPDQQDLIHRIENLENTVSSFLQSPSPLPPSPSKHPFPSPEETSLAPQTPPTTSHPGQTLSMKNSSHHCLSHHDEHPQHLPTQQSDCLSTSEQDNSPRTDVNHGDSSTHLASPLQRSSTPVAPDPSPQRSTPPHTDHHSTKHTTDDLSTIVTQWPKICDFVFHHSRTTRVLLDGAQPCDVDGHTLILHYEFPAIAQRLYEPRHYQILQQALQELIGGTWTIRCEVSSSSLPSPNTSSQHHSPLPSPHTSQHPSPLPSQNLPHTDNEYDLSSKQNLPTPAPTTTPVSSHQALTLLQTEFHAYPLDQPNGTDGDQSNK